MITSANVNVIQAHWQHYYCRRFGSTFPWLALPPWYAFFIRCIVVGFFLCVSLWCQMLNVAHCFINRTAQQFIKIFLHKWLIYFFIMMFCLCKIYYLIRLFCPLDEQKKSWYRAELAVDVPSVSLQYRVIRSIWTSDWIERNRKKTRRQTMYNAMHCTS